MQLSLMYQLVFFVLNTCTFVIEMSGESTYMFLNRHGNYSRVISSDNSLIIQDDKMRDNTGGHQPGYISQPDAVYAGSAFKNNLQNLLHLKYMMLKDSVNRMKRSVTYGNRLYKHLPTSKENNTSFEEINNYNKEVQNSSEVTSYQDPTRSVEITSRDMYAQKHWPGSQEASRAVDSTTKSEFVENGRIQGNDKIMTDNGNMVKGVTSSVEDLLHELSKRKNRPSWVIHLPKETATDHAEDKRYEVTESTNNMSISANNIFQGKGRKMSAVETITSYSNTKKANDPLSWPNISDSTYFTEDQGDSDNMSVSQSSTLPTTLVVDTDHPEDERQHLRQHRYPPAIENIVLENKEKQDCNELNKTGPCVNHSRPVWADGLLKLLEVDGHKSKMLGNFSTLRYTDSNNFVKAGDRLNDEKMINKESNDSDCPSCINNTQEEQVKLIRLNMFKNLLAQKLRLDLSNLHRQASEIDQRNEDRVPKIPYSIVEQTYKDNAREFEKDEFHAKDQELIIAGEDMGRDCVKIHATGCYSFNLKGRIRREVAQAQLWLYKMQDTNDVNGQTFSLYELERLKSGRLIQSSMIVTADTFIKEDWVVLNVTRSLLKWVSKRKGTEMVAIRCTTCATRSYRALYGTKDGYKPLLIIKYSLNDYMTRHKRSEPCDPRYECCKRHLVVNFQDIGMYDIIQPRNLSVGYCYGGCNEIHQYTYNHTAIKQRVRWSESLANHHTMNQQLKPCCVPLVLKDIFIMTSDGNGIMVRKLLPKVVVDTCGCM